jgi:hypothetical protein
MTWPFDEVLGTGGPGGADGAPPAAPPAAADDTLLAAMKREFTPLVPRSLSMDDIGAALGFGRGPGASPAPQGSPTGAPAPPAALGAPPGQAEDPVMAAMRREFTPAGQAAPFDLGAALGYGTAAPPSAPMTMAQLGAALGYPPASTPAGAPGAATSAGTPQRPAAPDALSSMLGPRASPTEKALAAASQQRMAAMQEVGRLQAEKDRAEGQSTEKAAADYLQAQKDDEVFRAKLGQDIQGRQQAIIAEANELSQTRINPNRVFQNESTMGKILSVVGLAMGGWLSTKMGGQNPALDIINKQIDNDIRAQMADVETRSRALGAKQTILQTDIAQGRDAYDARLKAHLVAYNTVIQQAHAMAEASQSDVDKARANQLAAEAQMEAVQKVQEYRDKQTTLGIQKAQVGAEYARLAEQKRQFNLGWIDKQNDRITEAPLKAAQSRAMSAEADLREAEAHAKLGKAGGPEPTNPLQVLGALKPTGAVDERGMPVMEPVLHGDKEVAKATNLELGKHQALIDALRDLIQARQEYGLYDRLIGDRMTLSGQPASKAFKNLEEKEGRVNDLMKKEMGSRGLPVEEVEKILTKKVGDATGLADNTEKWKALIEDEINDANKYLRQNVDRRATWTPAASTSPGESRDTIPQTALPATPSGGPLPPAAPRPLPESGTPPVPRPVVSSMSDADLARLLYGGD